MKGDPAVLDLDHGDGTPQCNRIHGNEAGLRQLLGLIQKALSSVKGGAVEKIVHVDGSDDYVVVINTEVGP